MNEDPLRMFKERGLMAALGFGERPALLVVDMMVAFTDPELPFGSDLDSQVEQAARLAGTAREAGVPVIFTVTAYDEVDIADAGIWALKVPASTELRAGTPEVELDPRLGRTREDAILLKKYASAFFGTDLAARLTARRVDTVVIAGCTTSGCVRSTTVDALQHGFRPIVALEAVGDRSAPAHDQSLLDMQAKYADVLPVDEILPQLSREPAAVRS